MAELEEEAFNDLGMSEEAEFRRIPITVNADSLSVWFLDAVSPFLLENRITLEIFVADQEKTIGSLRAGTVAGCIASEKLSVQGFTSTKIGLMRYVMVASPDFSRRWFPNGFDRVSAAKAPIIHFNRDDQLQYRALSQAFGMPQVSPPAHYIPSAEKLAQAVRRGLGYAMMPQVQASPEIESGRLMELDPRSRLDTPLFWYRWSRPSALLERFSEIMLTEGRRILAAADNDLASLAYQ